MLDEKYDKKYYNTGKIPKLVYDREGDYYIAILNETQEIRITLSFILDDIIKKLYEKFDKDTFIFDIGDGDEGCIYVYLNSKFARSLI